MAWTWTWAMVLEARDEVVAKARRFDPKHYANFADNPYPYGHP